MDKTICIGNRNIGRNLPAFIIAEIGSNHDGSLERAKELISAAREAGADAVKFQSFTAAGLLNKLRPGDGSTPEKILGMEAHPAYDLLDSLSLPEQWHAELKSFSDSEGIIFLSAPLENSRAELLNSLGVEAFKIASGDITNIPLLKLVASYGKPVILSTGASYVGEVEIAIAMINEAGNDNVALLHCVSLYPPNFEDVNIKAMKTMRKVFKRPVGISDHTPGSVVPLGAVALGASIIEKHITFDNHLNGPDHAYAMTIEGFTSMVSDIRLLESALGDGIKRPSAREVGERIGSRRSIYVATDIKAGETLTEDNLKVVRHAYGIEPAKLECIVGKKVLCDIEADNILNWGDIVQ